MKNYLKNDFYHKGLFGSFHFVSMDSVGWVSVSDWSLKAVEEAIPLSNWLKTSTAASADSGLFTNVKQNEIKFSLVWFWC